MVCSPRRRARETLMYLHAGFDDDVIVEDRLAEMDYGAMEGQPVNLVSGEGWTQRRRVATLTVCDTSHGRVISGSLCGSCASGAG